MIVKIHSRGTGGGSSPVDYLLGKDRNREGATLDRGDPEQMIELIDSSDYAQRYTSGVLSFAERDLPREHKDDIMDEFEKTLFIGLDRDQYSILWVEHQDKNRLELNFVVANVELQSGKRLQPYYDKADRPRVNAWKVITNAEYGLHDPDDPINKRELCTPNNLPRNKKQAAQSITDALLNIANNGDIKNRQDVVATIEGAGFEVARTTPKSISIKDPEGGGNIRLKGMIYEQDFRYGEELRAEIKGASQRYRDSSQERLRAARDTYQSTLERKREDHQQRFKRPERAYTPLSLANVDLSNRVRNHADNRVLGHSDVPIHADRGQHRHNQHANRTDRETQSFGRGYQNEPLHGHQEPQAILHSDQQSGREFRGRLHDTTRGIGGDRAQEILIEIRQNLDTADQTLAQTPFIDENLQHRAQVNRANLKLKPITQDKDDDRVRKAIAEQLGADAERQQQEASSFFDRIQQLENHVRGHLGAVSSEPRASDQLARAVRETAHSHRDQNQQLDRASEQISRSSQQAQEVSREQNRSQSRGFER
jgi:hypothetical protein